MSEAEHIDELVQNRDLPKALKAAYAWTLTDVSNAKAWSKLSYVHSYHRDYLAAAVAAHMAVALEPENPSYLFKLGTAQFKTDHLEEAAVHFGLCAQISLDIEDDFYLDAARIAQARCLLTLGRVNAAAHAIEQAAPGSATVLDYQQLTLGEMQQAIEEYRKA